MTQEQLKVPISVSLQDLYDCLCPSCREAFLQVLTEKADGSLLREALRAQFERAAHPEPVEGPGSS